MHFLRKMFYSTVIGAAVILSSCKAKEDLKLDEHVLFPVPVCAEADPEQKIADQRQACIEDLIKEHEVPFIADQIYFHESNKERYTDAMKDYGGIEAETELLWDGLKLRAAQYASITIIPRELIGKQKNSVLIVFPSAFETCTGKEDLVSFIADHEGMHALDNANGINLCGKKITYDLITQMGPQRYQDILELRAYGNQIDKIHLKQRTVSDKCATQILKAYFVMYNRVMNAGLKGNAYSISALQDAKYLPMLNLETKEILLFEKEQINTAKPR